MKKTPQPDIETLLAGVSGDEFLVFAKEYFGSHSEMRAAFRKWFLSVGNLDVDYTIAEKLIPCVPALLSGKKS